MIGLRVWILAVFGCNQVYGLEKTILLDARSEATYTCTDPDFAFSPRVRQVILQDCRNYTTSESIDFAVAECSREDYTLALAEGTRDGSLSFAAIEIPAGKVPTKPRLAPEGDRAVIELLSPPATPAPSVFSMFRRGEDGVWRREYDLPIDVAFDDTVGVPSRAPNARVIHTRPNLGKIDELVEDAPGTWRVHTSYQAAELGGLGAAYDPYNFTPDGLHLLFVTSTATRPSEVFHAVRARIDDRFTLATPLDGVPKDTGAFAQTHLYMNANCSRVYFSGLERVFYVTRR